MRLLVACLFAALAFPALAEDATPLTVTQCGEVMAGLMSLSDGYVGRDKDGKAVVDQAGKAVRLPFTLGKLRMPIAANLTLLRGIMKTAEEARQAMVKEMIPDLPPVGDPQNPDEAYRKYLASPKYKAYDDAYRAMMEAPPPGVTLTLARIKAADLKVGDGPAENPISPVTLSQLDPILDK